MAETDKKIEKDGSGQLPASEDIKLLEGLFIEKRRELKEKGEELNSQEIFRGVMKEYLDDIKKGKNISPVVDLSEEEEKEIKRLLESRVQELVEIALKDGLVKAVEGAYNMPEWFMRELYAKLTEKYHELIQAGMLKEI